MFISHFYTDRIKYIVLATSLFIFYFLLIIVPLFYGLAFYVLHMEERWKVVLFVMTLSWLYYRAFLSSIFRDGYKEVILDEDERCLTFIFFDKRTEVVYLDHCRLDPSRRGYSFLINLKGGNSYTIEYYLKNYNLLHQRIKNLLSK